MNWSQPKISVLKNPCAFLQYQLIKDIWTARNDFLSNFENLIWEIKEVYPILEDS